MKTPIDPMARINKALETTRIFNGTIERHDRMMKGLNNLWQFPYSSKYDKYLRQTERSMNLHKSLLWSGYEESFRALNKAERYFQNSSYVNNLNRIQRSFYPKEYGIRQLERNLDYFRRLERPLDRIIEIEKRHARLFNNATFNNVINNQVYERIYNFNRFEQIPKIERIRFDELETISEEIATDSFELAVEGNQIVVNSTPVISIFEIQETISSIESRVGSIEDGVNELIEHTKKLKQPFLKMAFFAVIFGIVSNIIFFFVQPYLSERKDSPNNLKNYVKACQKEPIRKGFPKEALKDYRVVSTLKLNVRQKATKKSRIITTINAGQVVKVIYKKRNWTLVELPSDDGNNVIRGWVFSRYLSKFKVRI